MPWLVRHVGWLLERCQTQLDGRTSFEKRTGKAYKHELYEFGEQLLYRVADKDADKKLEPR
eukprot:8368576-Prorocentrum_lima.AAC.1